MEKITRVGVDLAKNVMQVHAVDAAERVVVRKAIARERFVIWFANLGSVHIHLRHALASALCRNLPHHVYAQTTSFVTARKAPCTSKNPRANGFPFVSPRAPKPVISGSAVVAFSKAATTTTLRDAMQFRQPVFATVGRAFVHICANPTPGAAYCFSTDRRPLVSTGTPELVRLVRRRVFRR
jgi:hypothetical protein